MAFVIKSKRSSFMPKTASENIGPGEYLGQTEYKEIKSNKEPFLSGTKKEFKFTVNDNPGPGKYYQDEVLIKYLKNVHSGRLAQYNDKNNLLVRPEYPGVKAQIENLGFAVKAKRFKYNTNEKDNPGPGSYFPKIFTAIKKSFSKKPPMTASYKKKNCETPKVVYGRIPSIPANKHEVGFEVDMRTGRLTPKVNTDMYKTFSGEKGDTVGPGSYNLDSPSHWHKTGTEWSKFRETRSKMFSRKETCSADEGQIVSMQTTRYSDNFLKMGKTTMTTFKLEDKNMVNNLFSVSESAGNDAPIEEVHKEGLKNEGAYTDEEEKTTKELKEKKNVMNCRIKIVQKNNTKVVKKDNTYTNNIHKFAPGPGYYFGIDEGTAFQNKTVPEFRQFFGSRAERFKLVKTDNCDLGPATYFKSEEEGNKNNENGRNNRKNDVGFSTKARRFQRTKTKSDEPGPGKYEAKSSFNKKMAQTFYKFGSNQIRFFDDKSTKWKNAVPGPGSYDTVEKPISERNKAFYDEFTLMKLTMNKVRNFSKGENINLKEIRNNLESKFVGPPVGSYNPDVIFSINYNNQKKKLKNAVLGDVAFDTRVKKRFSNTPISDLGPGYYYREKKVKKQQMFPPFAGGEKKFKDNAECEYNTGPGQYNLDSYFDWNKRTYNVNFV